MKKDWELVKTAYVTSGKTLAEIAASFKLTLDVVNRHSSKERWAEQSSGEALFFWAVKKDYFRDIEDAKYQVFWSDPEESVDSPKEKVNARIEKPGAKR